MKRNIATALFLCVPALAQYPPPNSSGGGGGLAGPNPSCFTVAASTSCSIDVSALNLTSFNPANVQCWSGASSPFSPVTVTSVATTGTSPITAIAPSYSSTANVGCKVNATGGAGPVGATGAIGPAGEVTTVAMNLALAGKTSYTTGSGPPTNPSSYIGIYFDTANFRSWFSQAIGANWSPMLDWYAGTGVPNSAFCTSDVPALVYIRLDATGTQAPMYVCISPSGTPTWVAVGSGSGDVTAASTFGTNERVVVADGDGKGVKSAPVTIDSSGNVVTPGTIAAGAGPASIEGAPIANASVSNPATSGDHHWFLDASNGDTFSTKKSDGSLRRYVDLATAQTLTDKTLTTAKITGATNGRCVHTNASTGALETTSADCGTGGGSLTWSTMIGQRAHLQGLGAKENTFNVSATSANWAFNIFHGEDTTGDAIAVLQAQDTGTASFTWFTRVPDAYASGTLSVALLRTHSSGSNNVRWSVKTKCPSGAPPGYASAWSSYNTATAATVAATNTSFQETNIVTGIDVTGCSAGSPLLIHVSRLGTDGADTNTGTIDIWGIKASF